MKELLNCSLTLRIMGLIGFSLGISTFLLGSNAESIHHDTVIKQVKKQALVYLYGVEREIDHLSTINKAQPLVALLERSYTTHSDIYDFSVIQLRIYDQQSNTVAIYPNTSEKSGKTGKRMGHIKNVGQTNGTPEIFSGMHQFMGGIISHSWDHESGKQRSKTTITIPLSLDSEVKMALEAKLDMDATMALIQSNDDEYEHNLLIVIGVFTLVVLLAIWSVIHHGLLKPVHNLSEVTKSIAKGDLSKRARCHGRDEIGSLGQSINNMAGSIEQLLKDEEAAYLQAIESLMKALEAKDLYTRQHSVRVAKFSTMLANRLKLSKEKRELLRKGALMHDLGKISIPDNILNKPQALSDDEFRTMKSHPVKTAAIMRPLKRFNEFTEIAAWHHERWDGKGYPDGLQGEAIPLLARIVSIADAWDAMTGDRVYRKGMPIQKALSIFENESDSGQWDPNLVREFVLMIKEERLLTS
ncbi:MAG: HD domain-containing protein [Magnetococcales bacterium]|nr:HD domain-containing protein [Magnetococcales bacterium]